MDKEQQIKEVSETYEDIKEGIEIGAERFLKNMKNVLEIEKRQAVKEFAEKLKKKFESRIEMLDILLAQKRELVKTCHMELLIKDYQKEVDRLDGQATMADKARYIIDELLKEYEK